MYYLNGNNIKINTMKKILFFLLLSLSTMLLYAQKATVLEPDGVTTPRLTTAQRTALAADKGKVVFDTDSNSLWYHDGGAWKQVSSTGNSNLWNSSGQNIFYSNRISNNNPASSYTNATNYPIPDNNTSGITSFINIPLTGEVINPDLITISFSIAHTFSGDLKITLIKPNGMEIILVNRFGDNSKYIGSNVISINNLASGGLVAVGGIIPTGNYLSTGAIYGVAGDLADLNGIGVTGNWGLKIQDLSTIDSGNLISWSLSFSANCLGAIGKVGVGKNNPSERLDVLGNVNVSGNSTVLGNSINNSKVGIGTNTPNGDLQFGQKENNRKIVLFEYGNNNHEFIGLGTEYGSMRYQVPFADFNRHIFSAGTSPTTSKEIMTIHGYGNVGIGISIPSAYGSGGSNRILEIHNDEVAGNNKQSQVVLSSLGTSGFLGGITWASNSLSGEKRTGFIGNIFTSTNGTKLSFYNRNTAGALIENFMIKEDGSATLVGALTQNSDARLKRNINRLSTPLGMLSLLNGYSYHWKDKTRDQALQYGLIAQEVQKIYPNLVKEDDKGMLSVNYIGLIPILIESVKELKAENDQMTSKFETEYEMLKINHKTEYEALKREFNQRLTSLENSVKVSNNKSFSSDK